MDRLLELARPHQVDVDPERIESQVVLMDRGYTQLTPPMVEPLQLATLDALVGFCDMGVPADTFAKVDMNGAVTLWGAPHPLTKEREQYAGVGLPKVGNLTQCGGSSEPRWYQPEQIIPALLVEFETNDNLVELLRVLGNVRDGASRTYDDDGVAQTVSTRKGLQMMEMTELPSPLTLVPRATYAELDNQEQMYVLRAEGGDDNHKPQFLLARIVDPMFEYNRYQSICEYLRERLAIRVV